MVFERRLDVTGGGVAGRLAQLVAAVAGAPLPLALRAWDGSTAVAPGLPAGGPTLVARSPRALRHSVWRPGEMGLARAYVTGAIDVDGDFKAALRTCWRFAHDVRRSGRPRWSAVAAVPGAVAWLGAAGGLGLPPGRPREEARLRGRRHSRHRDRAAISHHYDLGNDFYELLLDGTMAYSCGYWTSDEPAYGPADAQRDKLDLICRQLGLTEGMRLLDVGCGWGSLLLHAAEHHGVHATGVTLSARQAEFVRAAAARRGLADRITVHTADYRQVNGRFDAVASVEMGEHVGEANYPAYCRVLHDALLPGGRLLLQQLSHGETDADGGAFMRAYIAPDMTMRPLHRTLGHMERAGFEVRHVIPLREHYVRTIDAWSQRLDEVWDEVVHRYGARRARIWRLYLAGSSLAFEDNRMGVHQITAVRPRPDTLDAPEQPCAAVSPATTRTPRGDVR